MKTLLFALLFCFVALNAQSQGLAADTTQANVLFKKAEILEKANQYDSAQQSYLHAIMLYEKHQQWVNYHATAYKYLWSLIRGGRRAEAMGFAQKSLDALEQNKFEGSFLVRAQLLRMLGGIQSSNGNLEDALDYFKKAASHLEGKQEVELAKVYGNIGTVYARKSQFNNALSYYKRSLSVFRSVVGEEHKATADTYMNMGLVCKNQKRYNEALQYHDEAIKRYLKLFSNGHPTLARVYNNKANVLKTLKRYPEAIAMYHKSLEITRNIFGETHQNVAQVYAGIGVAYDYMGKLEESVLYYQKSLDITKKNYPKKHLNVADLYDNLGFVYKTHEVYDSAAHYFHQAIKASAKGFESDNILANPSPDQALEKNKLMLYLYDKAEVLTLLGEEESALKAYAVAAQCAKLAIFEAQREEDKLYVAELAYPIHLRAAHLHFLRGKREQKK